MRTSLVLSASLFMAPAAFLPAEEARFQPDASFPRGILHASIASVSRLEEGLASTLLGRIATHPGVRKAFEGLAALVKERTGAETAGFARVTGKTPLELLGLIRGEVALHLGMSPGGQPAIAIALELGETKEAILEVRGKLAAAAEEMTGNTLPKVAMEGVEATAWPGPEGAILDGVLGTHLVIASSRDLFASIAAAHKAGPEPAEPREKTLDPDLARDLAVSGRQAILLLDLEALRGIVLQHVPGQERENVEKVLRVSGLDRLTSLGGALGFRDGGAESAWRLGMKDGPGGILGVLARSLPALGDLDAAMGRIPAAADEFQAGRIDIGGLLRGIDGTVREVFPELGPRLDALYDEAERAAGVSVRNEVFTLGAVTAHSHSIGAPAGGLFADEVVLVESRSVEPISKLLEKLAQKLGAKQRAIGPAGAVTYLNLTDGLVVEHLRQNILGSEGRGMWTPSGAELIFFAAASAGLARAEAGDGWTAISVLPQALARHLEIHSKGPRLASGSEGAELATLLRREAKGASAVVVSRGGRSILAFYNSLLPIANAFYPLLKAVGIDPAELPPGESFLGEVKPGYVRLAVDPKGFTLRGHRALETRAGVLAGAGLAGFAAGLIAPALQKGRSQATTVQCMSNLKQLYSLGMLYSDQSGGRAFPHSEEGSLASLQVLIDSSPEGLQPTLFICPDHGAREPTREGGRIVLAPDTTSYEVVPWRVKNTATNAILMYDREPVHGGRRNVILSDGSVSSMNETEFQKALAENRERSSEGEFAPRTPTPAKKGAKKKAGKKQTAE